MEYHINLKTHHLNDLANENAKRMNALRQNAFLHDCTVTFRGGEEVRRYNSLLASPVQGSNHACGE